MKASAQQQETLLELSRIDLQLKRNNRQIDEIKAGAQLQAVRQLQLVNSEKLLAIRNQLDALSLELNRAEVDLELVEGRLRKDEVKLQASSNQREVQAIQHEQQSLQKRKGELEDAELVLLERRDALVADLAVIDLERAQLQEQMAVLEEQQNAGLAKLNSGQHLLQQDRVRALAQVGTELAAHYESLFAKSISVGKLDGLVCDACGMTLSGDSIDAIKNTPFDELAHCGECGAILVR
jgi:predicted  nucleic acid-binding Zn-ribbon protein